MVKLQIPIPDTLENELKDMIRSAAAQAIDEAVQRVAHGGALPSFFAVRGCADGRATRATGATSSSAP